MRDSGPPASEGFVNQNFRTPNWYVLLHGIAPPDSTLVLAPGVSISPLPTQLTIFDLAAAGGSGFRAWAMVGQVAESCLCEIESAEDAAVAKGYDALNRAWLAAALLVLRGHGPLMPVARNSYSWAFIAAPHKRRSPAFLDAMRARGLNTDIYGAQNELPPFTGDLLDFHARILQVPGMVRKSPTADDAEWCRAHFDVFNRLCADSEKFRFGLEAAMDWRYAKDHRIAIARMWAGVEAILSVSSELVYRLSTFAAALLSERGPDRTRMFKHVKALYSIRSKAVHGDSLKEEQLVSGTADSFKLLCDLLNYCVSQNRVPTEEDLIRALLE